MKINITTNLSVEDDDEKVTAIIDKIEANYHLPDFTRDKENDWYLVAIHVPNNTNPFDQTLFFIQHFGKIGDSGYIAYELKNHIKNRKELDLVIKSLESQGNTPFMRKSIEMIKALKLGGSLMHLMREGILTTHAPHCN